MAFVFEQTWFPKQLKTQSDFMMSQSEYKFSTNPIPFNIHSQSIDKQNLHIEKKEKNIEKKIKNIKNSLDLNDQVFLIIQKGKQQRKINYQNKLKQELVEKEVNKQERQTQEKLQLILKDKQIEQENNQVINKLQIKKIQKQVLGEINQDWNQENYVKSKDKDYFIIEQRVENPDYYDYNIGKIGYEKGTFVTKWDRQLQLEKEKEKTLKLQKQKENLAIKKKMLQIQESPVINYDYKEQQTAQFKSGIQKDHYLFQLKINKKFEQNQQGEFIVDTTPGPGYYSTSQNINKNKYPKQKACFNWQDRFYQINNMSQVNFCPGAYDNPSMFIQQKQQNNSIAFGTNIHQDNNKEIEQTKQQNISQEKQQQNQHENVSKSNIVKKSFNVKRNFFGEQKRFSNQKEEDVAMTLNIQDQSQILPVQKPYTNKDKYNQKKEIKAPFNSSLAKNTEIKPNELPGPASYSQQFYTIENQLQQNLLKNYQVVTKPKSQKLQKNQKENNDFEDLVKFKITRKIQAPKKQNPNSFFASNTSRFIDKEKSSNLDYVSPKDDWNKKSFNKKFQ